MERELLTRNFMTGWVFAAAFLSAWAPARDSAALTWLKTNLVTGTLDLKAVATVILAVLASPIVGYVVSSVVLLYMYLRFGDPYNFHSRVMAERLVRNWEYCPLCDSRRTPAYRGIDLFAYLAYSRGPELLIEWGRRRHTARFLGHNWAFATALGLGLGSTLAFGSDRFLWFHFLGLFIFALLLAGLAERLVHRGKLKNPAPDSEDREPKAWAARYQPYSFVALWLLAMLYSLLLPVEDRKLVAPVIVACISFVMLILALMASREVEEVERQWVCDYFEKKLLIDADPELSKKQPGIQQDKTGTTGQGGGRSADHR